MDWMEDMMLGAKRAAPFWRSKKQRLAVERALAPKRSDGLTHAIKAEAVIEARTKSRVTAEARKKGRFAES